MTDREQIRRELKAKAEACELAYREYGQGASPTLGMLDAREAYELAVEEPEVILDLFAELEQAERERDTYRKTAEEGADAWEDALTRLRQAERERDEAFQKRDEWKAVALEGRLPEWDAVTRPESRSKPGQDE